MMTDRADGAGGAASSVRLSSDNASDASDGDSLAFANLDTRKRKEVSYGGPDAAADSDHNKRVKHEFSENSGASLDTHSNCLAEQATSAEEIGAPEVDTSFRSTDNDEYSRCDTSAFSSGEEGFGCRDPFLQPDRHKQPQRDDSWGGERNLLQLQLGSFIQKEKLKLESESEGCSGLSRHSLSSGYDSIESLAGDRFSGNSGSLSGFLRGSNSFAESSENAGYYPNRASSMLSSIVRNKKANGFDLLMKKDEAPARHHPGMRTGAEERVSLTNIVPGVSWPSFPSARLEAQAHKTGHVHQKFVLSSGRPSNVTATREDTRVHTIDRDFDDYFAKLML